MTEQEPLHHSATGGRWLHGLTFQHPTDSEQYRAETATIAADHWRGHGLRTPTETETEAIKELNYETPAAGEQYLIRFSHGGTHYREVIIGPDDIAERPEGGGLVWWHPACWPAERLPAGADDGEGEGPGDGAGAEE